MSLHVIVGDVTDDLRNYALSQDQSAYLIDSNNVTDTHTGTVFVSIGDLKTLGQFYQILSCASKITYCPPGTWTDKKNSSIKYSMAWLSEHYIRTVSNVFSIEVINLPKLPVDLKSPIDVRKTDQPQLWCVGCSTTFGIGVEIEQRWPNLLAKEINLEMSLLATSGASNPWMADQILRSDIQSGDIVVLGVGTYGRQTIVKGQTIINFVAGNFRTNPELIEDITPYQLDSDTKLYESLGALYQVQNFCNKVDAKLILIGIHANIELSAVLSKEKNFVMLQGTHGTNFQDGWIDIGNDNQHPGPKMHQLYTKLIVNKLHENNII